MTYAEWGRRSDELAGLLVGASIHQSTRIGLAFPAHSWIDFAIAYVGVIKARCVAIPLDPQSRDADLLALMKRFHITAVLRGDGGVDAQPPLVTGRPTIGRLPPAPQTARKLPKLRPTDLVDGVLTHGTTGWPRLALATHAQLLAGTRVRLTAAPNICVHAIPPWTALGARSVLWAPLRDARATNVFFYPFSTRSFLNAVRTTGATSTLLTPTMARALLADPKCTASALESVRIFFICGAYLPPSLHEALVRQYPLAMVLNVYGLTEAGRATVLGPFDASRPGSIGRVQGRFEFSIRRSDGTQAAVNELGEICLRHRHLDGLRVETWMPDDDSVSLGDGWVHTGDIGRRDRSGHLYFFDRKADVINTGGLKVSTLEVEDAVRDVPTVTDAAVVGLPHPTLGEVVGLAYCATATPCDVDVLGQLRSRLSQHKWPSFTAQLPDLPVTALGKPDKQAVRSALLSLRMSRAPTAPQTSFEERVARLWATLLSTDTVDCNRDFVDHGGDSLMMAELAASLQVTFQRECPLPVLLQLRTVRKQARWFERPAGP